MAAEDAIHNLSFRGDITLSPEKRKKWRRKKKKNAPWSCHEWTRSSAQRKSVKKGRKRSTDIAVVDSGVVGGTTNASNGSNVFSLHAHRVPFDAYRNIPHRDGSSPNAIIRWKSPSLRGVRRQERQTDRQKERKKEGKKKRKKEWK